MVSSILRTHSGNTLLIVIIALLIAVISLQISSPSLNVLSGLRSALQQNEIQGQNATYLNSTPGGEVNSGLISDLDIHRFTDFDLLTNSNLLPMP